MNAQTLIILILIGIAAGMLGGMVGVGGGIIIVPALVFFLGFSQKMAQGTSLGILLLPVGLLGVMQFYKEGYVDIKVVLIISAGFFLGSYLGSRLSLSLSQDTVKKAFAVLLIIVAVKMLFFDSPVSPKITMMELKKAARQNNLYVLPLKSGGTFRYADTGLFTLIFFLYP